MEVQFWCDNGANIHSRRIETLSLEQLGLEEDEWKKMSDDERMEMVREWALERFDWGYEVEED